LPARQVAASVDEECGGTDSQQPQNHLGALVAGSPGGVNLPTAIKISMSLSAMPGRFAVAATSRRAGKFLAAQVASAAGTTSSVIFEHNLPLLN
jgi:hypothetical protein